MTRQGSTFLIHNCEIRRPRLRGPASLCAPDPQNHFSVQIIQWIVNEQALFLAQAALWERKVIWSINYVTQHADSYTPLHQNPLVFSFESQIDAPAYVAARMTGNYKRKKINNPEGKMNGRIVKRQIENVHKEDVEIINSSFCKVFRQLTDILYDWICVGLL